MQLSGIKGKYDLVIGLGAYCQVAYQLGLHNLRQFACPIDWIQPNNLDLLAEAISNKLSNLFLLENLTLIGTMGNCYLIKDKLYDCISAHDFQIVDGDDWASQYDEVIVKLKRRSHKMFERINSSNDILFVRIGYNDKFERINDELRKIIKCEYKILALHLGEKLDSLENDYVNICAVEIPYVTQWKGVDEVWDYLLDGISLR